MRDAVERLSMKRVSACNVGLGQVDARSSSAWRRSAIWRRPLEVPVITIPAEPAGAPLEAEAPAYERCCR